MSETNFFSQDMFKDPFNYKTGGHPRVSSGVPKFRSSQNFKFRNSRTFAMNHPSSEIITCKPRRGTCLALRFQTGSWMLFIDSRNSNKMATFYTVHTSSIRIFNCLYFPDVTLETYQRWRPYTFSASQIDCTPLDS